MQYISPYEKGQGFHWQFVYFDLVKELYSFNRVKGSEFQSYQHSVPGLIFLLVFCIRRKLAVCNHFNINSLDVKMFIFLQYISPYEKGHWQFVHFDLVKELYSFNRVRSFTASIELKVQNFSLISIQFLMKKAKDSIGSLFILIWWRSFKASIELGALQLQ